MKKTTLILFLFCSSLTIGQNIYNLEFFTQEIPENITLKVFKKFLEIIKRKDRQTETEKSIKSIYRSGKASNLFTKKYDNINLSHDSKLEFRKIVRSLVDDPPP